MPNVDHALRELRFKVVYYGPGLGGKTSNLEYIHRKTKPELRGKLVTLNDQSERTLFFDLLPMELGRYRDYAVRVHLCTVPGQIAHDRVRQLVLRNVDGVVMVVDSQPERLHENRESMRNLESNLRLQGEDPGKLPTVVQYNKRDLAGVTPVGALRRSLQIPDSILQIEAIASRGDGVLETFKAILAECLSLVGDPARAPAGRNPSIVPGQRVSMFPEAEPAALGHLRSEVGRRLPRLEGEDR